MGGGGQLVLRVGVRELFYNLKESFSFLKQENEIEAFLFVGYF